MAGRAQIDPIARAIALRIRAFRGMAKLTIERVVAADGHLSKGNVSKIENGQGNPTVTVLDAIARSLNVRVVDLVISPEVFLRDRVIDATRELGDDALRELLSLAQQLGAPSTVRETPPFREANAPTEPVDPPLCIPLLGIDAAAGAFDPGRVNRGLRYVVPLGRRRLTRDSFVIRVVGRSMEPLIPSGSYAIFSKPPRGDLNGKVVLVQLTGLVDADTATSYTVKRFRGTQRADGGWRNVRLVPDNRAFRAIDVDPTRMLDLEVIAELVETLDRSPCDPDV